MKVLIAVVILVALVSVSDQACSQTSKQHVLQVHE
jgi:hypothetical protein